MGNKINNILAESRTFTATVAAGRVESRDTKCICGVCQTELSSDPAWFVGFDSTPVEHCGKAEVTLLAKVVIMVVDETPDQGNGRGAIATAWVPIVNNVTIGDLRADALQK